MLWVKTFHVFFVIGWFAELFYLPRILVNLAQVPDPGAERDRLLLMARKLRRFGHMLSGVAVALGLWLWLGFHIGDTQHWIHAKLLLVVGLFVFEAACGRQLKAFQAGRTPHDHVWYRWFNEIPTVLLAGILVLVIVQPF